MTEINKVIIGHYASYNEAFEDMTRQEVTHLGWENDNKVRIPEHYNFERVFMNRTGTSCLFVDRIHRVSYSVDMGD